MYFWGICGSNSSAWTNNFKLNISKLIQNKKKHKLSPMLILTSLNSFFSKALSFFRFLFSFYDLLSGSAAMLSMLRLIFWSLLKCLLACAITKKSDIKRTIKPVITMTTNVMLPKYLEVWGSKTLKSITMTTAYTIVVSHTTAIAINDSLVWVLPT